MSTDVPALRFVGFDASWEQRKLGELVQFSKGSGYSKADLKESGTPIILYGRLYTKYETVIADVDTFADAKTGSIYSHGGEVIVPASGETAEDISIASVVEKSGVLLGGDLNIITPPTSLDSAFLAISISNGKPHDDMAKMAQGKSVVHLHNSDLGKINLAFPNYEEQVQISTYFKSLDNLITLHQKKVISLKKIKTILLDKMFPKNGMDVPEIRFAGFDGVWEQRKLGDHIIEYHEVTTENNQYPALTSSRRGIFLQTEYFDGHQVASADNTGYNIVPFGYFTYRHMSDDDVFYFNINDIVENGIVSTLYPVFTTDDTLDSRYLQYQLNHGREFAKYAVLQKQGGSRTYMYLSKLKQLTLTMPKTVDEQRAISGFLMKYDNLITLHQNEVMLLKNIKKSALLKMFVKGGD